MMIDDTDWTSLARYFAGECSPEEAEVVRRWIEADPERPRRVEALRAAWAAAATPDTSWDTRASWHKLAARVRTREVHPHIGMVQARWSEQATGWKRRSVRWAAIAAAVVLAAGAGLTWRRMHREIRSPAVAGAAPHREVRTPLGRRAVFKLPDGSRVVLGPGSVLRYDSTRFGVSTRELELEGSAFFSVTHDARRPFWVRTARTVTQDLGTDFTITDYREDRFSEVVVASGTVAVRSTAARVTEPAMVLTRGQLVRLDSAGGSTLRRDVNLTAKLAWTDGRLVFAGTPVGDVIAQVNRWYGIQVRLGDPALAAQRFTGSYSAQSDSVVLHELATAIGARVKRRDSVVVLEPVRGH